MVASANAPTTAITSQTRCRWMSAMVPPCRSDAGNSTQTAAGRRRAVAVSACPWASVNPLRSALATVATDAASWRSGAERQSPPSRANKIASGPERANLVPSTDPAVSDQRDPTAPLPTPVMLRDLPRTVLVVLLIAVLLLASFWILRPFLLSTIWAMMIVIATWPMMLRLQGWVRRRAVAVAAMSLAMLVVFIAPVMLMIQTLADHSDTIAGWVRVLATSPLPPPPAWVHSIPLFGDEIASAWNTIAEAGKGELAARVAPYADDAAKWLARAAGSVGLLVVQLLLTLVISVILYSNG